MGKIIHCVDRRVHKGFIAKAFKDLGLDHHERNVLNAYTDANPGNKSETGIVHDGISILGYGHGGNFYSIGHDARCGLIAVFCDHVRSKHRVSKAKPPKGPLADWARKDEKEFEKLLVKLRQRLSEKGIETLLKANDLNLVFEEFNVFLQAWKETRTPEFKKKNRELAKKSERINVIVGIYSPKEEHGVPSQGTIKLDFYNLRRVLGERGFEELLASYNLEYRGKGILEYDVKKKKTAKTA